MTEIHGRHDPAFAPVRDAFAADVERGEELAPSVSVAWRGETVVDPWAGDAAQMLRPASAQYSSLSRRL